MLLLAALAAIALGVYFLWKRTRPVLIESAVVRKFAASDAAWDQTEPLPVRPFANKRNFNPSMGIRNMADTAEDWLLLDNKYLEQTKLRKKHTTERPEKTTLAYDNVATSQAVKEYYGVVTSFLLQRYPQYFRSNRNGSIDNLINGETMPQPGGHDSLQELVQALAANIQEDFLVLIKDKPEGEYILRASVTGFPAGFDPSHNHNQPVSFIHKPVPQYESRLKSPMTNFFNKLDPKHLWIRHNWSIQTHEEIFNLDSLHGREGEVINAIPYEKLNFNTCFLRVERQIFFRLPVLRAIIMTVRTYLTPLKIIKEEGLAAELSRAIDSLPEDLAFYKRRGAWGEAVKQYLGEE